jgi:hypothetical protein
MDAAGHLPQIVLHAYEPVGNLRQIFGELAEPRGNLRLCGSQREGEGEEPLLGAVVQVTLDTAEELYWEAIAKLDRGRVRPALARAHLLYGEWLRCERRHPDARDQLATAHEMLTEMGIHAFAERAARELLATGATVRKRLVKANGTLTP